MSLDLYFDTNDSSVVDVNNIFSLTFDGRVGGAQARLLYLRNNERSKWYENITVSIVDTSGINITDNSVPGWYWKLTESEVPLSTLEWSQIAAATPLTLSVDIGSALLANIHTYIPIWIYVCIPRNQPIQTIRDIRIRIEAQESLVG